MRCAVSFAWTARTSARPSRAPASAKELPMIRRSSLLAVILILMSAYLLAQSTKSNDRAKMIGTWELSSTVEHMKEGSSRPYQEVGPKGKGYLMYTADGHMCAAGMNPDRPAHKDANKP